jgi:hypothetical protein
MTTTVVPTPSERVSLKRLLWAGPLAIVLALIANGIVRAIALALLDIPADFQPLQTPAFIFLTVVLLLGAILTFAVIGRLSRRPVRTFQIVALIVLVLSFIPDIGLLASGAPGATLPGILVLMLMHVIAAGIVVWVLGRFAVER